MFGNSRLLIVGLEEIAGQAPPPDFATIQEAIDAANTRIVAADQGRDHDFTVRYTVFVLPGTYRENVEAKPWVNVVGISKEDVYIVADGPASPAKPAITLSSNTNFTNLSILSPVTMPAEQFAIVGENIAGFGLTNIDVYPAGGPDKPVFSRGKGLRLSNWSQAIITRLGISYYGNEFAVELSGPPLRDPRHDPLGTPHPQGRTKIGWNSDCHLIDCFIDALNVDGESGGCLRTKDCYEVHIRNSILRTSGGREKTRGAALRVESSGPNVADYPDRASPLVNVLLEGSSLYGIGSPRVLHIGEDTQCVFNHSSSESFRLPYRPDMPSVAFGSGELDGDTLVVGLSLDVFVPPNYAFVENGRPILPVDAFLPNVSYDK
jgi:hypothetical protein